MEEVLIPLGLFAIIPVIVWTIQHHRQKAKERSTEVIKAMIDKDIGVFRTKSANIYLNAFGNLSPPHYPLGSSSTIFSFVSCFPCSYRFNMFLPFGLTGNVSNTCQNVWARIH